MQEPPPEDDASPAIAPGGPRALSPGEGVSFALLAHPTVLVLRFLVKLALPWFVTTAEFGEAMLAGLIVFGLQHVAVFGLDEALVSAPRLDRGLWGRMRRFQALVGMGLFALLAVSGVVLGAFPEQAKLGVLLSALAPMLVIANAATLPTALLVRERRYAKVFLVDVAGIVAYSVATLSTAVLGGGPWSLIAGWYANAIAAVVASRRLARAHLPGPDTAGAADWPLVRRTGAHLTGAAVLGYVGERLDSLSIGFVLGRAVLGLYEFGQQVASSLVNYASSLAERLLFPTLAAHHREQGLGRAYLEALRITLLFVLPLHVLLALAARPLVETLFPPRWHEAWPLLVVLALAAAARCFDLVASTALKAAGRGRTVFRLGIARLLLLVLALVFGLTQGGVATTAYAVLASRTIAAVLSLAAARRSLDLSRAGRGVGLGRAGAALGAWILAFGASAWYVDKRLPVPDVMLLVLQPLLALGLWSLARLAFDREAARHDFGAARTKLAWARAKLVLGRRARGGSA